MVETIFVFDRPTEAYSTEELHFQSHTLEDPQTVLAISPHPDDLAIGPGGLLYLLSIPAKHLIIPCIMTSGWRGVIGTMSQDDREDRKLKSEKRRKEVTKESKLLYSSSESTVYAELKFYDLERSEHEVTRSVIEETLEEDLGTLSEKLEAALDGDYSDVPGASTAPRVIRTVLIPHPEDEHPQHKFSTLLALKFLSNYLCRHRSEFVEVLYYESPWGLLRLRDINYIVPLPSNVMAVKIEATRAHRSQIARTKYEDVVEGLAKYRAASLPEQKSGYGRVPPNWGTYVEVYERVTVAVDDIDREIDRSVASFLEPENSRGRKRSEFLWEAVKGFACSEKG